MGRLLGPVWTFSWAGWGAALSLGVGALLPAALAPGCVPPGGVKAAWSTMLAQDSVPREAGFGEVALGRVRLRLAPARLLAYTDSPSPGAAPAAPTALASVPADTGPCGDAGWFTPAPGAPISQDFGVPDPEYAAGYHTGVDFAVFSGTPLLAIAHAVVEEAGWGGAYGNWIVLRLPDGHFALYAHMSRLDVETGDHVPAGSRIGFSGESGNARGPHLHFEIRTEDHYGAVLDPLPYLRAHRCRV